MDWMKQVTKRAKDSMRKSSHAQRRSVPVAQSRSSGPHRTTGTPGTRPSATLPPVRVDQITTQVRALGPQQSNLPHIYRDGGGGGTVGGQDVIIFADSTYTKGPPPTESSRIVGFVSNSIAVIGPSSAAAGAADAIERVTDFGTLDKGPDQAIPFLGKDGESPLNNGIWPNQNMASLLDHSGHSVAFPEVIDRNLFREQKEALLYNTAIEIRLQGGRPTVTRTQKSLFVSGEPMFGSFAAYAATKTATNPGTDGYLYLFARVSETGRAQSNGLKLARVKSPAWADRTHYEYWDGRQFGRQMPALDDGGTANVFHYSQEAFGKEYGPGSGDVFWSPVYKEYLLLFQNAAAALDNSVYLSHSPSLTGGWSEPTSIYKLPRASDGFSYAFHAYPNMDPTGRAVPITWTKDSKSQSCFIDTAEILFT
ncbi:amino acid permease [Niveomyces insectorum RCEF 264]|uniref:Amino acid permease n=1 Tax=Niveomyces insectorum RCEF 264 TaxID=1081102 RepID=A0A167XY14_9HYPO|nr:amino acid permease [Niveomyces insectorum RCEF 264]